ncbi:hypothetical protein BDA99DRAFT_520586, partial [Phascolomyces articulosus]
AVLNKVDASNALHISTVFSPLNNKFSSYLSFLPYVNLIFLSLFNRLHIFYNWPFLYSTINRVVNLIMLMDKSNMTNIDII